MSNLTRRARRLQARRERLEARNENQPRIATDIASRKWRRLERAETNRSWQDMPRAPYMRRRR